MFVSTLVLKRALTAGTLVVGLAIGTGVAHADPMTFAGTTAGSFSGSSTDQTLSFNSGAFNGTTSNSGFVGFGENNPNGSFGTFTLGSGNATFNGDPFTLTITFSDPTGITGGPVSTYSATVIGSVTGNNGGANVSFSPSSGTYTFANSAQTGTFTLNLDSASLHPGQTTTLDGFITSNATSTVTPEPNSLMLLGTGFVSAAGMLMRRRKMMTA